MATAAQGAGSKSAPIIIVDDVEASFFTEGSSTDSNYPLSTAIAFRLANGKSFSKQASRQVTPRGLGVMDGIGNRIGRSGEAQPTPATLKRKRDHGAVAVDRVSSPSTANIKLNNGGKKKKRKQNKALNSGGKFFDRGPSHITINMSHPSPAPVHPHWSLPPSDIHQFQPPYDPAPIPRPPLRLAYPPPTLRSFDSLDLFPIYAPYITSLFGEPGSPYSAPPLDPPPYQSSLPLSARIASDPPHNPLTVDVPPRSPLAPNVVPVPAAYVKKPSVGIIGIEIDPHSRSHYGQFSLPLSRIPDPSCTIIMENIPYNLLKESWVCSWCTRLSLNPVNIQVDHSRSKALVELSSAEEASVAFSSPVLQGFNKMVIGVFRYRKLGADIPAGEVEEGEIQEDANIFLPPAPPAKLTKAQKKALRRQARQTQPYQNDSMPLTRGVNQSSMKEETGPIGPSHRPLPLQLASKDSSLPLNYDADSSSLSIDTRQDTTDVASKSAPMGNDAEQYLWISPDVLRMPHSGYGDMELSSPGSPSLSRSFHQENFEVSKPAPSVGNQQRSTSQAHEVSLSKESCVISRNIDDQKVSPSSQLFISHSARVRNKIADDILTQQENISSSSAPQTLSPLLPSSSEDVALPHSSHRHHTPLTSSVSPPSPQASPPPISTGSVPSTNMTIEDNLRRLAMNSKKKRLDARTLVATAHVSFASHAKMDSDLDDLATAFITETIQTMKPAAKTTPSNLRSDLAIRQQKLEQYIAESKELMTQLSQARTKWEKDEILSSMRELSRMMDDNKEQSPTKSSITSRSFVWPDSCQDTVLIISDDEDGDEDLI